MKMNEVFIDICNLRKSGLATGLTILKRNSKICLSLSNKEIITKDKLNNHEKRLFSLFEKKFQYSRSINKDMKKNEIDWGKAELVMKGEICNKQIHLFFYEELDKHSDYMVFKPLVAYNKDIIVALNVFNSLQVSF
uniref:Uncharacterized protein n=1 Tax=uncultured prokaryote TaxID=198431 RepID=A0A0H5QCD9_9ZZZZ|nr:hypothetical protein [uncultured prokaryote]